MNTPEVELPAASEFTWTTVDGAVTSVQGEPVVLLYTGEKPQKNIVLALKYDDHHKDRPTFL